MTVPVFTRSRAGLWTVLAASAVQVPHTGDTNETALATITVPGGAMGANGILRVTTLHSFTNGADDKTLRVRFSGISGTAYGSWLTTATATLRAQCQINNRNAENSQAGATGGLTGFGPSTGALTTSAVDTTVATTIVITGQLENGANAINLESYLVELLYRP